MFNSLFPESHAIYEIKWKCMAEPGRPQMTIQRMQFACRIIKAIDTYPEYIMLIACPLQQ